MADLPPFIILVECRLNVKYCQLYSEACFNHRPHISHLAKHPISAPCRVFVVLDLSSSSGRWRLNDNLKSTTRIRIRIWFRRYRTMDHRCRLTFSQTTGTGWPRLILNLLVQKDYRVVCLPSATQSWENAAIKSGWMCGRNWGFGFKRFAEKAEAQAEGSAGAWWIALGEQARGLGVLFLLSPIVPFVSVRGKYRCVSVREEFILKSILEESKTKWWLLRSATPS